MNYIERLDKLLEKIGDKKYILRWSNEKAKEIKELKVKSNIMMQLQDLDGIMYNNISDLKKMKGFHAMYGNFIFFDIGGNKYRYKQVEAK